MLTSLGQMKMVTRHRRVEARVHSIMPFVLLVHNFLTDEMKPAGVGVDCKGRLIPALLYADDMVLLAEEMLRKELKISVEWCVKWAIKVNVGKCIVHFRKRRVKRIEEEFRVNGRELT